MTLRLQKFLAAAGLGSRRACELLIAAGRVAVDGRVVSQQGVSIDPRTQQVAVDGRPVSSQSKVYILLNKPRGVVCTASDPEGRRTFLELLPGLKERVFNVGRLDFNTEGLLLATNDGSFAYRLTHPKHQVPKIYHLQVTRAFNALQVRQFKQGITLDGEKLVMADIRRLVRMGELPWYEVTLLEGRNRHIRRMVEPTENTVRKLIRVRIGPLELGSLKPGAWRRLTDREIEGLLAAAGAPDQPAREEAPDRRVSSAPPRSHPRTARGPGSRPRNV